MSSYICIIYVSIGKVENFYLVDLCKEGPEKDAHTHINCHCRARQFAEPRVRL